jgi:Uma2 family endonuclease
MHQWASANLVPQLNAQLLPFGCFAIAAPFDVYLLYDQGDEDTFVQPDVSVLCNRSKLQPNRYNGAPRFLIEILSSDRRHDMELKRELYLQAGVEEYWIIDPEEKTLTALTHSRGMYLPRYFGPEEEAPLSCIPGCKVDLRSVLTLPWEKQGEYGVNG